MKRIYSYIAALLMLSLMASQVHAKEPVTQSDISGSAKEKCVSSEQTNDKIEADLQRHLERMKSEDIAKGYLREEKTYAEEVSLVRGRLYHSTDKLIHDEKKTTLLSYPVGRKVPCKKSLKDIDSYTDTITRKGMTFRIPKGAELKMFYMLDNNIFIVYEIGDVWYSIQIIPLDVDHPDSKDIENKVLVDKEYNFYHTLQVYWRMWGIFDDLQNPTYSAVWNNGLPGMLVDSYNPEFKAKKHRLFPDERIIRIYEY